MKIALQHRNRIWRALVEYRNSVPTASVDSHPFQYGAQSAVVLRDSPGGARGEDGLDYSVVGGDRTRLTSAATNATPSGTAVVDGTGRVYDVNVMKFTYRHKFLLKEEDHNYC